MHVAWHRFEKHNHSNFIIVQLKTEIKTWARKIQTRDLQKWLSRSWKSTDWTTQHQNHENANPHHNENLKQENQTFNLQLKIEVVTVEIKNESQNEENRTSRFVNSKSTTLCRSRYQFWKNRITLKDLQPNIKWKPRCRKSSSTIEISGLWKLQDLETQHQNQATGNQHSNDQLSQEDQGQEFENQIESDVEHRHQKEGVPFTILFWGGLTNTQLNHWTKRVVSTRLIT